MRRLDVKIHYVLGDDGRAPVLATDTVVRLFASSGIDLRLTNGRTFTVDPAHSASQNYDDLLADFRARDRSAGHLVLGQDHPEVNLGIAGELRDLESRGMAIVYAKSLYINGKSPDRMTQTAAHELGHMFNLAHVDVDPRFDSAMNQARERDQAIELAWDMAGRDAQAMRQDGKEPFLSTSGPLAGCYPFAFTARGALNTSSEDEIKPWRSPYNRPYDGADDRWRDDGSLTVEFETDRPQVGGPLAFIVKFEAQRDVRLIPTDVGPTFDNLIVKIERPDGTSYFHRPRRLACSRGQEAVGPGDQRAWAFCTVRAPDGNVFKSAGTYKVTAIAPQLGATSASLSLEVEDRDGGKAIGRLLNAPQGPPSAVWRRRSDEMLQAGSLDAASRSYLGLKRLQRETDPGKIDDLETFALDPSSPSEVRHAAVVLVAKRLRRENRLSPSRLDDLISDHLHRPVDRQLARRIAEWNA